MCIWAHIYVHTQRDKHTNNKNKAHRNIAEHFPGQNMYIWFPIV